MINIKNIWGKTCKLEDVNGDFHDILPNMIITIPHSMVEDEALIEGVAKGHFIVFPNIGSIKAVIKNKEELETRFDLMDFEPE